MHPFRNGSKPREERLLCDQLDGVEIINGNQTIMENYLGIVSWHKHRFTAVSGSDSHDENMVGIYPAHFDHPVHTIGDVMREIKAGRCRPFLKEIPKSGSNIIVNEISFGTKGADETRNRIILKKVNDRKKWSRVMESAMLMKDLHVHGFSKRAYRVPDILTVDVGERLIIEEGQRGRTLFELLLHVKPFTGKKYYRMAAKWLAKLHLTEQKNFNRSDTAKREHKRLSSYRHAFEKVNSPFLDTALQLIDFVELQEKTLLNRTPMYSVLNHGDYHPKNIIIGQDHMQDISTLFISVIDFNSTIFFHPAFDVGCFLSQFRSQFAHNPFISDTYSEEIFISTYKEAWNKEKNISSDFDKLVNFFKIRANLSIASYLIKVGKGTDPQMRSILEQSERIAADYVL